MTLTSIDKESKTALSEAHTLKLIRDNPGFKFTSPDSFKTIEKYEKLGILNKIREGVYELTEKGKELVTDGIHPDEILIKYESE